MRLIDADKLKSELIKAQNIPVTIGELIDMQSTAEPETGEWLWEDDPRGGKWLVCSCCGRQPVIGYYGDYEETDYCPNCGAKMKESEVNNG